jgi:hypothetical protein
MSGNNTWTDAQPNPPAPVAKKPMSGCLLASLIIGGIGGISLLLCCGTGFWLATKFVPTITAVPAEVEAVGQKVLVMQFPEGLKPNNAITMDNSFFSMRIAQFKHQEGKGELVIGNMKLKIGDDQSVKMQSAQFRSKFETDISGSLDTKSSETIDVMINGQKVSVQIAEAKDRTNGKDVHTAKADIPIPTGQAFILLRLDDEIWNQEAVVKMLEEAKIPE